MFGATGAGEAEVAAAVAGGGALGAAGTAEAGNAARAADTKSPKIALSSPLPDCLCPLRLIRQEAALGG